MTGNSLETILVSFLVTGVLGMYPPSGAAGPFTEALKAGAKAYANAEARGSREVVRTLTTAEEKLLKYFGRLERVYEILERLNDQADITKLSRGPSNIEAASKATVGVLELKYDYILQYKFKKNRDLKSIENPRLTAGERRKIDSEVREHLEELTAGALRETYGDYSGFGDSSIELATRNIEKLYSHAKRVANFPGPSPNIIMVEADNSMTVFSAKGSGQEPPHTVRTDSMTNIFINAALSGD